MDARDSEAFRALYREHYAMVCRYLAARTEGENVEDLAAETFPIVWRRQAELPAHLVPWLLNTAGKVLANHRRSRERALALADRLALLSAPETAVSRARSRTTPAGAPSCARCSSCASAIASCCLCTTGTGSRRATSPESSGSVPWRPAHACIARGAASSAPSMPRSSKRSAFAP